MPKSLAPPLGFVFGLLILVSSPSMATDRVPFFLLLNSNGNFHDSVKTLETAGVHIRLNVPPRIIVGDSLPSDPIQLSNLGQIYKNRVPLSDIRPLGPLATAAALEWNKTAGGLSGAPMGAKSLSGNGEPAFFDAPQISNVVGLNGVLDITWNSVEGAFFYDVQICQASDCSTSVRRTTTDRTHLVVPVEAGDSSVLYIRVRAGERPSPTEAAQDRFGSWSVIQAINKPLSSSETNGSAPQPTSPVDAYEGVGFSTVLEWAGADRVRLQLSKFSDFHDTLVDQIVEGNEFTPASSALHVGDQIFWRLAAWSDSQSPWSAVRSYSILEPRSSQIDMFVNPEAPR